MTPERETLIDFSYAFYSTGLAIATPAQGIGNGFWWSAVTMTTVGYGDKAPVTRLGRVLATIWMFVSVITISSFTAAIASSITLTHFSTSVQGVDDLARVRSVAVEGSTGEQFLRKQGIRMTRVAGNSQPVPGQPLGG